MLGIRILNHLQKFIRFFWGSKIRTHRRFDHITRGVIYMASKLYRSIRHACPTAIGHQSGKIQPTHVKIDPILTCAFIENLIVALPKTTCLK